DRNREHAAVQHARPGLGVLLLRLRGGERRAVSAVDIGRQRELLGVVVAERLSVVGDRALEIALAARERPGGGIVVADRRPRDAATRVVEAPQIVLALHARAAALV